MQPKLSNEEMVGNWFLQTLSQARKTLRVSVSGLALFWSQLANAQGVTDKSLHSLIDMNSDRASDLAMTAIFLGTTLFALFAALAFLRGRGRAMRENGDLKSQLSDLSARNEMLNALVNVDDQCVALWPASNDAPIVFGNLPLATGVPAERELFLGFGRWLDAESAAALEAAADRLRLRAEGFDLNLKTITGSYLEAQGRTSGGAAFIRFSDLSGERAILASTEAERRELSGTLETIQSLFQEIESPAWLRASNGQLAWVNNAYVLAVGAESLEHALQQNIEILETADKQAAQAMHEKAAPFSARVSTTAQGVRKRYDVVECKAASGFAGFAFDVTDSEAVDMASKRLAESHAATLDLVSSAVATFDAGRVLVEYNSAFSQLWGLSDQYLESKPTHEMLLERLRADGTLSEPADWKRWKEEMLAVYQGIENAENLLHLPDGRTLHVHATQQREGGVTWIYENLTDKLALEGRFEALTKIQGESLENLAEGVAVFGSDGRLQLSNSSFGRLWGLEDEDRAVGTHIAQIAERSFGGNEDQHYWLGLASEITGIRDQRESSHKRLVLDDGSTYDCAVLPMPEAQTMLTFVDVSDSVMVAEALRERNEALEAADVLKAEFVANISYELRTLLTNIKGFNDVLISGGAGPISQQQEEYLGHVQGSALKLETAVDSMLDLASMDAGLMQLELEELQLAKFFEDFTQSVSAQLQARSLMFASKVPADVTLVADAQKLSKILGHLVANATRFSPEGSVITLSAKQSAKGTTIIVQDQGPGIPQDFAEEAFGRFAGRNSGDARKGAGLGLAVVRSLMSLHGGDVQLLKGKGAQIACHFPDRKRSSSDPTISNADVAE